MQQIQSQVKTIGALLSGTKYNIDYYQRDYSWETKHVTDLIDDLTDAFDKDYDENHARMEVANYSNYFMGSIVVCTTGNENFIVDGQQRLTTLTLILTHLYRKLESDDKSAISPMIFSSHYGQKSFNLDVPEREDCMNAMFEGYPLPENSESNSVRNMIGRYQEIEDKLSDELTEKALPYFSDWLTHKVNVVEIMAFDDGDAYEIFETMNDRGLSLTPADMLKGYLLSRVSSNLRSKANDSWIDRVSRLKRNFGQDADADTIKAWLRSQYANTIRVHTRGAGPGDFDKIGTEFHRWVRSNESSIGLESPERFLDFIERDFEFYARWYEEIRNAANTYVGGLECVFYNNWGSGPSNLQYFFLLSSLKRDDPDDVILQKIRVASRYIDILIHRRTWNWRNVSYNAMRNNFFSAVLAIRNKNVEDLTRILYDRLMQQPDTFMGNDHFRLTGNNRRKVHDILARITDYVGMQTGDPTRYTEYMYNPNDPYQIEHVWANKPERHADEFDHPEDFRRHRNRIGGLLLLPRSFNAAYGAKLYEKKYHPYFGQNILAQSLHEHAYQNNPKFLEFKERSGLPFRFHIEFKRSDFEARQKLYQQLAEKVWNPDFLYEDAGLSKG